MRSCCGLTWIRGILTCLFDSSATASSLLTFPSSESISLAVCFLSTLAHPLSTTSPESDEEYNVAEERPTACLRAATNICNKLPSDATDFLIEAVPLLTNLLQYHDAKVLEHASVCFTRIVEAFAASPDKLDEH
ncbi:hypothetical protein L2E82_00699 [Cichorium intybus]|uniref:Uncharacterized protein n=1 Tax=Cichorium intybus TaxID=13427 RepID=A0ACB9GX77_CICIN|nr:hypothetical protein L2E82_00699 [Cichorium intybus]